MQKNSEEEYPCDEGQACTSRVNEIPDSSIIFHAHLSTINGIFRALIFLDNGPSPFTSILCKVNESLYIFNEWKHINSNQIDLVMVLLKRRFVDASLC